MGAHFPVDSAYRDTCTHDFLIDLDLVEANMYSSEGVCLISPSFELHVPI